MGEGGAYSDVCVDGHSVWGRSAEEEELMKRL